jgi:hypothetical protein
MGTQPRVVRKDRPEGGTRIAVFLLDGFDDFSRHPKRSIP